MLSTAQAFLKRSVLFLTRKIMRSHTKREITCFEKDSKILWLAIVLSCWYSRFNQHMHLFEGFAQKSRQLVTEGWHSSSDWEKPWKMSTSSEKRVANNFYHHMQTPRRLVIQPAIAGGSSPHVSKETSGKDSTATRSEMDSWCWSATHVLRQNVEILVAFHSTKMLTIHWGASESHLTCNFSGAMVYSMYSRKAHFKPSEHLKCLTNLCHQKSACPAGTWPSCHTEFVFLSKGPASSI